MGGRVEYVSVCVGVGGGETEHRAGMSVYICSVMLYRCL